VKATFSKAALTFGAAVVLNMVALPGSLAHLPSQFYDGRWEKTTVNYHFSLGFPSDPALRDRVHDGAKQWNALAPDLRFDRQPDDVAADAFFDCPSDANTIRFPSLDGRGETLGEIWLCPPPGGNKINRFKLRLDSDEDWYKGTGDPPSTELDAWSVTAHEFGHATGWIGHFGENSDQCPGGSQSHTMCRFYDYGLRWMRSLETHDRHTFVDAYP